MKYVLLSSNGAYMANEVGRTLHSHMRTFLLSLACVFESEKEANFALARLFSKNIRDKYIFKYHVVHITKKELFIARLAHT